MSLGKIVLHPPKGRCIFLILIKIAQSLFVCSRFSPKPNHQFWWNFACGKTSKLNSREIWVAEKSYSFKTVYLLQIIYLWHNFDTILLQFHDFIFENYAKPIAISWSFSHPNMTEKCVCTLSIWLDGRMDGSLYCNRQLIDLGLILIRDCFSWDLFWLGTVFSWDCFFLGLFFSGTVFFWDCFGRDCFFLGLFLSGTVLVGTVFPWDCFCSGLFFSGTVLVRTVLLGTVIFWDSFGPDS